MKPNCNGLFLIVAMVFFLILFESIEGSSAAKRQLQSGCQKTVDGIEIGAEYFLYNKKFLNARLAQWGSNVGTVADSEIELNQLWAIESWVDGPSDHFTIRNVKHPNFRLAKWGSSNKEFGVYDGNYHLDQFWRFEKVGKYYRIYNYRYPSDKITKFFDNDDDVGTYSGPDHEDQLWKLIPRYNATSVDSVIFSFNNDGSSEITKTIAVTVGVTKNMASSLTATIGFKTSVSASIKGIVDAKAEFKTELSSSVSRSVTTSYSKTNQIKFIIPAHVNYKVSQKNVNFKSLISSGNFQFHSSYEVREESLKQ